MNAQLPLIEAWNKRKALCAEGYKLFAEGDKLWTDAVLEKYGAVELKFNDDATACTLANGDVYK
jgi:hypothetical protein